MNKYLLCTLAWATMVLPLPALGQMGMQGRGMMGGSMMNNQYSVRRYYVMQNGFDPRYASQENPLEYTSKNISDGKRLYDQNCAMCHGTTGMGDGPAGRGLNPPPANIAAFIKSPMETDGYLYWTIAEGGAPLKTAMPSFKNSLKENDIWKIIMYLRGL